MKSLQLASKVLTIPAIANGLAIGGALVYLVQSISYAFSLKAMFDEGLFLYKGYLFATGVYFPYQDYGPWTHKAPLSYLIPGYIELWFGPGLRTGRVFSVLVSVLFLLGLWLVARRLGGQWWAAAAVWAVAFNPAVIKLYTFVASQGLAACLLVWVLVFSLGEDRPTWQITVSAFLASLLLLTRQNMALVLLILVIYIFWQYGHRGAIWAIAASLVPLLIVHLVYWPGILRMWAPWLPAQLTPFLDHWRPPQGISAAWLSYPRLNTQLATFFSGFRFHFTALVGGVIALILWPRRMDWKSRDQRRTAVFLATLFVSLMSIHLWAGLGNSATNNYNAHSFVPYLAFFVFIGLLLMIVTVSTWPNRRSVVRYLLAVLFILAVSAGIGYAGFETFGDFLNNSHFPRIRDFRLLPGTAELWRILANKFGWSYWTSRQIIPPIAGLGIGSIILVLGSVVWLILRRNKTHQHYAFGSVSLVVFLLTGTLLSPTVLLGGGLKNWDCTGNVINSIEQTGQHLAQIIPPGSRVYWQGRNAVAVLLYVPDIHIYPQQLDEEWNYWIGGDADTLARHGSWNDELMRQWQHEADIFIIQQSVFTSEWQIFLDSTRYEELISNGISLDCSPDTYLRVFRKR